jgi:hypothetical protein
MAKHPHEHCRNEDHRERSKGDAHQQGGEFGLVVHEQFVGELENPGHNNLESSQLHPSISRC